MEPLAAQPPILQPVAQPIALDPDSEQLRKDGELIDDILYLATLASRREDVDGMLDDLRLVTAGWDRTKPLDQQDRMKLIMLEGRLKDYLLHGDPLRAFTAESLEERVRQQHESAKLASNPTKKSLIIIIALILAAAGTAFVVPPYNMTPTDRLYLSTPLMLITLHIGIAWLYLTAARNFKPDVQRMLRYISAGVIAMGVSFSYFAVLQILGLADNPFLQYIGQSGLFVTGYALICVGLKIYANLLGIVFRRAMPIFVAAALVAVGLVFIPHAPAANDIAFDIGAVGIFTISLLGFVGGTLAMRVKRKVTAAFTPPLTLVMWYMYMTGVGAGIGVIMLYFIGDIRGDMVYNVALGGTVSQSVLLLSGYLFKKNTGK